MSADTKHHVTILGYKVIDFRNKKDGSPGQLKLAQCIVKSRTEEKGDQIVVGELMMPKHLMDVPTGEYLAEFELSVGQDLRIGSRLTHLHPYAVSKPAAAAAASVPAGK
jgi:hypothetical protein